MVIKFNNEYLELLAKDEEIKKQTKVRQRSNTQIQKGIKNIRSNA